MWCRTMAPATATFSDPMPLRSGTRTMASHACRTLGRIPRASLPTTMQHGAS